MTSRCNGEDVREKSGYGEGDPFDPQDDPADDNVVDDRRRPLPPGEVGEIAIRGNVMQGYYNMPEATA
ncbi:MAG: AMP-binding protein, partial [Pirellulaceae bacterium]